MRASSDCARRDPKMWPLPSMVARSLRVSADPLENRRADTSVITAGVIGVIRRRCGRGAVPARPLECDTDEDRRDDHDPEDQGRHGAQVDHVELMRKKDAACRNEHKPGQKGEGLEWVAG